MGITGEAVVADETIGAPDATNAFLATWASALASPAPAAPSQPSTPDPGTDPGAQDTEAEPAPANDAATDPGLDASDDE